MPTTNPYTFCLYNRDGKLLVNCYGNYSGPPMGGEILNGVAATRADADKRIAELRAKVTLTSSVVLWRHGRAVRSVV